MILDQLQNSIASLWSAKSSEWQALMDMARHACFYSRNSRQQQVHIINTIYWVRIISKNNKRNWNHSFGNSNSYTNPTLYTRLGPYLVVECSPSLQNTSLSLNIMSGFIMLDTEGGKNATVKWRIMDKMTVFSLLLLQMAIELRSSPGQAV